MAHRQRNYAKMLCVAYHGFFVPADVGFKEERTGETDRLTAVSINYLYGNEWAPRGSDLRPVEDWVALRLVYEKLGKRIARLTYAIVLFEEW